MTHRPTLRDTTLALLAAAACLGACARYAWVNELDYPGGCPTAGRGPFPLRGTFGADSAPAALAPGEIDGVVVRTWDAVPIAVVDVAVRSVPAGVEARPVVRSDTLGRFRLAGLEAGRYELVTRRLGYAPRRDTVRVGAAGVRVRVGLEPQTLDGPCSGFAMLRVSRPWWKIW